MNTGLTTGVICGILIGLVLVVILFKVANTNHKASTQYDERQEKIRGKAYQYGFYAIAGYEVIMLILTLGEVPLPFESYQLHFGGIILGSMVLAGYSIWHDSYWGLNNNLRRYCIVFAVAAVLNAIPAIGAIASNTLFENGKPGTPFINLLALIMILFIGAELLIRHVVRARLEEETAE